ncbi:hypothetical protein BJX63DRAFT_445554 [Aspergillus granulosus]|uniref:Uncharacterized protein n=1 Tax=Aspergillus granulosus TaxID=176169 RepID=A0ABR4H0I2_9EURO
MAGKININNDIYKLSAYPFVLEHQGDYEKAIKIHRNAIEILDITVEKFKTMKVPQAKRKMFVRQANVHRERLAYLQSLKTKGSFEGVVKAPSVRDAIDGLAHKDEESPWSLFQIRQVLYHEHGCPFPYKPFLDDPPPHTPQSILFTPSLPPEDPTIYRITLDSEFLELGSRALWYIVKDASNTHTLYALQAIWNDQVPITEAVLRQPAEFPPQLGALTVPDRGEHCKDWSPRRFEYGGRKFVWKNARVDGDGKSKPADGGLFKSFAWETLYETERVWRKAGSQTGKMEDKIVSTKLCWGEKGGVNKADHTIYMGAGLDVQFREHLLAVQLARLVRCSNPPKKDTKGVEAISAGGSDILSILNIVSQN